MNSIMTNLRLLLLAALMIAVEFFWYTEQRSVIGLMAVMCGRSVLHILQKVL